MSKGTKYMFLIGLLSLIIAVLYGILPLTSPVNPYLAIGSMCFLGGLLLGLASFGLAMEYKTKRRQIK